jgi:hypothetical protein
MDNNQQVLILVIILLLVTKTRRIAERSSQDFTLGDSPFFILWQM